MGATTRARAVTGRGPVLAFCERRIGGSGDAGYIDLVRKRSTDGGATRSEQQFRGTTGPLALLADGNAACYMKLTVPQHTIK